MKRTFIAGLLILGLAASASAATSVTVVVTYSSTAWSAYAVDSVGDNDGIAAVCFKIGNVLTAYNVSPRADSYMGDGSWAVADTFGFSSAYFSCSVGSGVFEIICGQSPAALQGGETDPKTGSALFLRHIGQSDVSYTIENNDGSQSVRNVATVASFTDPVLGGTKTGGWVKIAQGTKSSTAIPTIVNYAGGITAGANVVVRGGSRTQAADSVNACVIPTSGLRVAITSPTSTNTAAIGNAVSLTATASTGVPGMRVAVVQFYDGTTLLGSGTFSGTNNTWTYAWNTASAAIGNHNLTAKATDNLGTSATSSPPTVVKIENVSPTVAITSPTSTYTAAKGATVSLVATAATAAPGRSIASVQFYDGTTLLGRGTFSSAAKTWTYAWNTASAAIGNHNLTAKATDNLGTAATSSPPTVVKIVSPSPTVAITSPTSTYAAAKGATVNLVATAAAAPGRSLASVQFYDGTTLLGRGVFNSTSNTWTYAWNTACAVIGNHNLTAKATDNLCTSATSSSVVVRIVTPTSTASRAAVPAAGGIAPRLVATTPTGGSVLAGVTRVTLFFDSDVRVAPGAVEVVGLATGAHPDYTAAYNPATRALTITWARALPADVYTVRVIADFVVGASGGASLDGETGDPAAPTLPSGNGTQGGDARLEFTIE